ncbi:O-antigen ligase [Thiohalomonas denitrificans]|uniref:O-antigen ligase n=1 Tax=Thiohalomonas denitrificans TaxID=415747 RepID=A0A1G5R0A3_9GAMM|nr:O-antigen ligase [Thiohalomonas denitrificans]
MHNEIASPQQSASATSSQWLFSLVRALVFLFPITVATVGWGSSIFVLLLLPALYYGRGWNTLSTWEQRLMLGYVLVFAVMVLSMVNAQDFKESGQMLERFLRLALIVPIYLMFRRFRFCMGRELAAGALVACFAMGAQAIYEVMWQGESHAEGYYHKIVFGDLAVWWAAVVAVLATTVVKNGWARAVIAVAISVALYASVLSQTRGAWLFIPLIPAILLWSQWHMLKNSRNWIVAGVAALMVIGGGAAFQSQKVMGGIERGVEELQSFENNPGELSSWGTRLNLWRNSLLLLQETPILGSGVGDFRVDMERLVEEERSWSRHVVLFSHAHSIYFDALARGGILGLLTTVSVLLVFPFVIFARELRRSRQPWSRFYAIGGVMLIAAFAVFGFSEGLWARNPLVNTYVTGLVVLLAGAVNSREDSAQNASPPPGEYA